MSSENPLTSIVSVRYAVKVALFNLASTAMAELAATEDDGIAPPEVHYGWPGTLPARRFVWIGDCVGESSVPAVGQGGNRLMRRDIFDVDVHLGVKERGAYAIEAEATVSKMWEHLEKTIAENHRLDVPGANGVTVATIVGPESAMDEGASLAAIDAVFNVSTDLI